MVYIIKMYMIFTDLFGFRQHRRLKMQNIALKLSC